MFSTKHLAHSQEEEHDRDVWLPRLLLPADDTDASESDLARGGEMILFRDFIQLFQILQNQ